MYFYLTINNRDIIFSYGGMSLNTKTPLNAYVSKNYSRVMLHLIDVFFTIDL